MKYLKKVSASQLISSQGAIIDSMNPGDDQTVNAPSIHAVKDYVENYSTTEQRIGTWIDGKPLYRRTVSYTVSTGTGWNNIVYIPNVDFIFVENFTYKKVLGGSNPTELYLNNYGAFQFYWTSADGYVKEKHTSTYADGTPLEITVKYTKTTD